MLKIRLDKFVWSVRLCKTRSQGTELISKGQIKLNSQTTKPSKEVEEKEKFKAYQLVRQIYRQNGDGKPTKKDRRDLDSFLNVSD